MSIEASMVMKEKSKTFALVAVVAAIVSMLAFSFGPITASAQKSSNPPNHYVVQKTAESMVDPLPGHSGHQAVLAVPPRSDGKVWQGTISWSASWPVELVILQKYDNKTASGNQTFGKPLTAPFGGGEVAISLIKTPSGTGIPSGTMNFVGDAVAFHTLSGHKFTVTYTADATAESLSKTK